MLYLLLQPFPCARGPRAAPRDLQHSPAWSCAFLWPFVRLSFSSCQNHREKTLCSSFRVPFFNVLAGARQGCALRELNPHGKLGAVGAAVPMLSQELQQQGPIPSTSSTVENPASKTSQSIASARLKGSPDGISACSGAAGVYLQAKGMLRPSSASFVVLHPGPAALNVPKSRAWFQSQQIVRNSLVLCFYLS